jgi:biofilm PGA synthesis lipoprotein PgaB
MRQMHLGGARNFGYYPDDFLNNQPEETLIKPVIFMETPNTPQNGTH